MSTEVTMSRGRVVRPPGAFERTIDFYLHRNPIQFSLVAEMDRPVSASALASAPATLQDRHPLLGVAVDCAAPEAITDGVGGLRALLDLVAALAGEELTPPGDVPHVQENLLAHLDRTADGDDAAADTPVEDDERMSAIGELTPFAGRTPHVDTLALDRGLTTLLVRRCRQERTSVHAALCAATAADIQITNLGVAYPSGEGLSGQSPSRQSPSGLSALRGPAQITQLRGEHILGVVTVGGRLRMTELTHDPVAGLVPEMVAVLADACAETPQPVS
ncbi:hypothetical protein ACWGMA_11680 [Streptomyces asiaticus]